MSRNHCVPPVSMTGPQLAPASSLVATRACAQVAQSAVVSEPPRMHRELDAHAIVVRVANPSGTGTKDHEAPPSVVRAISGAFGAGDGTGGGCANPSAMQTDVVG